MSNIKKTEKEVKRMTKSVRKVGNVGIAVRIHAKGTNSGENVRFAEIEDKSPRSAAISTDQTDAVSEENWSNFAVREVLISETSPCQSEWNKIHWGEII